MRKKFKFAPGLPGYGTKGDDGLIGSSGLSFYYSSLDGLSDQTDIKNRIENNQVLYGSADPLPGDRVYQTGDIFIDVNSRLFEIDLDDPDLFIDTTQQLDIASIFQEIDDSGTAPNFERWRNNSDVLVDNAFVETPIGDHSTNPDNIETIYGLSAKQFGRINYVDFSINNEYHGFNLWVNSVATSEPEKAVAFLKEDGADVWHLGNVDSFGNVRDVSLFLDFKAVHLHEDSSMHGDFVGNFYGSFDGSVSGTIEADNLQLPGWLNVTGDTSLGDLYVTGTTNFYDGIDVEGGIIGDNLHLSGWLFVEGDTSLGNLYMTSTSQIFLNNGTNTSPAITFRNEDNTGFYRTSSNNQICVATGGTENFRFDDSTFHAKGDLIGYSGTLSDIRLKTNIKNLDNSLDKILKLRSVTFNDIKTGTPHIGYIAQEVEEIIPDVIFKTNILGEDDSSLYKAIRYTEIIPYLSDAIKKQQKMIEQKDNEIKTLKNEINEIKSLIIPKGVIKKELDEIKRMLNEK